MIKFKFFKKKEKKEQDWIVEEDYFNFDEKTLEFFFNQADTFLSSLISVSDSFQNRAINLIVVLVPVFFSVVGVAAYSYLNLVYLFPLAAIGAVLFYCLIKCLQIIYTKQGLRNGSEPLLLVSKVFLEHKTKQKERYKHVLLNECSSYQLRINDRIKANKKMGENLKLCIRAMLAAPIIGVIYYIVCIMLL